MEKEDFVPYQEALALKKLAFNVGCIGRYWNSDRNPLQVVQQLSDNFNFKTITNDKTSKSKIANTNIDFYTAAPTYRQVFKWFRITHKYHGEIIWDHSEVIWYYAISKIGDLDFKHISSYPKNVYGSFEEAELECVKKLIEIIKNEKSSN